MITIIKRKHSYRISVLKVSHVTNGDDYNIVSQSFNQFEMYDIGYYKNSQSIMIDGTAIVVINC